MSASTGAGGATDFEEEEEEALPSDIELDGDEFHGPDRWQADMNRQRVLERAGWTFWRCFASTWSLHREEVLQELSDLYKMFSDLTRIRILCVLQKREMCVSDIAQEFGGGGHPQAAGISMPGTLDEVAGLVAAEMIRKLEKE